jgi:CYTH domain-containing protein
VHARFAIKHRPGSVKPGEDSSPYKTMDRYEQVRVYYVGLTWKSDYTDGDGHLLKVSAKHNDAEENIVINDWVPNDTTEGYYYLNEKSINYQNDDVLKNKAASFDD